MSPIVSSRDRGFTLIELLVAMAIFVIMIAFLGQLMSNTSASTSASKGRLDADDQARFAFDRIGQDLLHLSRRSDLDYQIQKKSGNDEIYFYSEVPGLTNGGNSPDVHTVSGLSLVGYRINSENQLERYSESKTWDQLSFLTYAPDNSVDPTSKVQIPSGNDPNYHVLCNGIFRFEITFLLRDGTYSTYPSLQNGSLTISGSDKVGKRQWPEGQTSGANALCMGLDSSGNQIWRGLGWRDVSAVIVSIAVIDDTSRKIVASSELAGVVNKFGDTTGFGIPPDRLPMAQWSDKIKPDLLDAKKAVAGIRIYQRAFYLSTL